MTERLGALYHWSPVARRAQIIRRGLEPRRRPTVSTGEGGFRQPHICLSPTPSLAWSLSGQIITVIPEWDLWQVRLEDTDEVVIRPQWGTIIEEIQVRNRIPKSRIWHVGTRTR